MSGVDRLALVAKILLDVRFLELKRENESLKLRLFWFDHCLLTLRKMLQIANNSAGGPKCRCASCVFTKRYEPDILDGYEDEHACKFQPWFEQLLQKHGMSFRDASELAFHDNVHFHVFSSNNARNQWVYGGKLCNAHSTADPELVKLAALFEALGEMYEPHWEVLDALQSGGSDSDS
jgi:hypothetical protein